MTAASKNIQSPQILLTPRDAARALAISDRSLARLVKRGDITPVRLGGGRIVRYTLESLQELIEVKK